MTDKIRNLLEDVQTVYEGKGMIVHPNSFDELRTEIMKLDNINRLQGEQIEKIKSDIEKLKDGALRDNEFAIYDVLDVLYKHNFEVLKGVSN